MRDADGYVNGVIARDAESGEELKILARHRDQRDGRVYGSDRQVAEPGGRAADGDRARAFTWFLTARF